MMKKLLAILLITTMFLLSGCGNSNNASDKQNTETNKNTSETEEDTQTEEITTEKVTKDSRDENDIYKMTKEEFEEYLARTEYGDVLAEYENVEFEESKTSSYHYPAAWKNNELVDAELESITIKTVYKSDDELDYVFFIELNDYDCRARNVSVEFVFNEDNTRVTKSKAKKIGLTYSQKYSVDYKEIFVSASFRGEDKSKDISVEELSLYFTDANTDEHALIPLSSVVEKVDYNKYVNKDTIYSNRLIIINDIPYLTTLSFDSVATCAESDNSLVNMLIYTPDGFKSENTIEEYDYVVNKGFYASMQLIPLYPSDFSEPPIDINELELNLAPEYRIYLNSDIPKYKSVSIDYNDDGVAYAWNYHIDYLIQYGTNEDINDNAEFKEFKSFIKDLKARPHILSIENDEYVYRFGSYLSPYDALNLDK